MLTLTQLWRSTLSCISGFLQLAFKCAQPQFYAHVFYAPRSAWNCKDLRAKVSRVHFGRVSTTCSRLRPLVSQTRSGASWCRRPVPGPTTIPAVWKGAFAARTLERTDSFSLNPVEIPFPESEAVRPVCRPGKVTRLKLSAQTVGCRWEFGEGLDWAG